MLDNPNSATTIHFLRRRISLLEAEVDRLLIVVNSYANNTEKGKLAENYIAELCECLPAAHGAGYDLQQSKGNVRFEVKFSSLHKPVPGSPTRRWEWTHLLGAKGEKLYDRLILVGEIDPRFTYRHALPDSPYVLFDVPFSEVASIANRFMTIKTVTNPTNRKLPADLRLFEHQISVDILKSRYGCKPKAP